MIRRFLFAGFLSFVVIVVALLVGADEFTRVVAEHQIADRAKATTGAQSGSASISSFPFLYHLVADGEADKVSVHLRSVPVGRLTLDRVDVSATGVHLERTELLEHHKVILTSVKSATASLTVSAADLAAATGVQVQITETTVTATYRGVSLPVTVGVSGHDLTLQAAGVGTLAFDLAKIAVVPPCTLNLATAPGALTLGCTVSPVPAAVLAALSAKVS